MGRVLVERDFAFVPFFVGSQAEKSRAGFVVDKSVLLND